MSTPILTKLNSLKNEVTVKLGDFVHKFQCYSVYYAPYNYIEKINGKNTSKVKNELSEQIKKAVTDTEKTNYIIFIIKGDDDYYVLPHTKIKIYFEDENAPDAFNWDNFHFNLSEKVAFDEVNKEVIKLQHFQDTVDNSLDYIDVFDDRKLHAFSVKYYDKKSNLYNTFNFEKLQPGDSYNSNKLVAMDNLSKINEAKYNFFIERLTALRSILGFEHIYGMTNVVDYMVHVYTQVLFNNDVNTDDIIGELEDKIITTKLNKSGLNINQLRVSSANYANIVYNFTNKTSYLDKILTTNLTDSDRVSYIKNIAGYFATLCFLAYKTPKLKNLTNTIQNYYDVEKLSNEDCDVMVYVANLTWRMSEIYIDLFDLSKDRIKRPIFLKSFQYLLRHPKLFDEKKKDVVQICGMLLFFKFLMNVGQNYMFNYDTIQQIDHDNHYYGILNDFFQGNIEYMTPLHNLKKYQTSSTTGGSQLVHVLGRDRKVTIVGRKQMITYNKKQISLSEARKLEKEQKNKKSKSDYTKTSRTHTDKKGATRKVYTKAGKDYVKCKSPKTGKMMYKCVT